MAEDDEDLSAREWAFFVVVGIPIVGVSAVAHSLVLEDDQLGDAIGVAIIVMAISLVGVLLQLARVHRHRSGRQLSASVIGAGPGCRP